jgi:hypothetical protein
MSFDRKYCILSSAFPILFIHPLHKDMAAHGTVTSAGFFKLVAGRVETYGHSHSLKLGPGPEDAKIIAHFLGLV